MVFGAPAGEAGRGFDVSVTKSDSPDPVGAGAQLTYTINLSVTGIGVFTTVNDVLPAQTTFVSVTAPVGWTCPTTPAVGSGGTVSCSGPLNPGTPVTITLVVRVNAGVADGTTITNTAGLPEGAGITDSDSTDNSATVTTTVRAAAVAPAATVPTAGVGAFDALPAVPVTGIPSFTG